MSLRADLPVTSCFVPENLSTFRDRLDPSWIAAALTWAETGGCPQFHHVYVHVHLHVHVYVHDGEGLHCKGLDTARPAA